MFTDYSRNWVAVLKRASLLPVNTSIRLSIHSNESAIVLIHARTKHEILDLETCLWLF